jgi:CRISPR-associated protein Cas5d
MTHDRLSPPVTIKVWGERALFTRPEMKVERVSYEVMTPAAARGVLEAICWKPQMRWVVQRIDVLNPIRWDSVRRNEVSEKASAALAVQAMRGGDVALGIEIEDKRQQRASLILRDVAYTIHARIALTDRAGTDDTAEKYMAMFRRRAARGQCFHHPYLGTREFAADFALVSDEPPVPIDDSHELGWVFHDFDFTKRPPQPRFFKASLDCGRLFVPPAGSIELHA